MKALKVSLFLLLATTPHTLPLVHIDPEAFDEAGEKFSEGAIRGINKGINKGLEQAPQLDVETFLTKLSLFFVGTACACYGVRLLNKSINHSLFPAPQPHTTRPVALDTQDLDTACTAPSNTHRIQRAGTSVIGTTIGGLFTMAGLFSIANAQQVVKWLQN